MIYKPTAQHGLGLSQYTKANAAKPSAVLQPVFYVMVFVSQRTCTPLFFLQTNLLFLKMYLQKNKPVQLTTR